jgi:hypothetical protein
MENVLAAPRRAQCRQRFPAAPHLKHEASVMSLLRARLLHQTLWGLTASLSQPHCSQLDSEEAEARVEQPEIGLQTGRESPKRQS